MFVHDIIVFLADTALEMYPQLIKIGDQTPCLECSHNLRAENEQIAKIRIPSLSCCQ